MYLSWLLYRISVRSRQMCLVTRRKLSLAGLERIVRMFTDHSKAMCESECTFFIHRCPCVPLLWCGICERIVMVECLSGGGDDTVHDRLNRSYSKLGRHAEVDLHIVQLHWLKRMEYSPGSREHQQQVMLCWPALVELQRLNVPSKFIWSAMVSSSPMRTPKVMDR